MLVYGMMAAVIYRYMKLYNQSEDGTVTVDQIKQDLLPNSLKLIGAGLLSYIMVLAGALLCLIPGLYIGVVLTPMAAIIIEENKGIGESIGRSFDLVKENWWRTFGFMFVMYVIVWIGSSIFQLPISFAMMLGPIAGMENPDLIMGISMAISIILGYITTLFLFIAAGIWYYSLVEQQEGVSLFKTMDQIGKDEDDDKPNLDHFR